MAQTQQPGDGEGELAPGTGPGREPEGPDATASSDETTAAGAASQQPTAQGQSTAGRGVAAALGTLGDGRYRLTHRLGRGGMAEVLAAQDVRLGRTVAVKLLRPELAQDDVARQRFTREAHSVAGLNHHSIVAVYDSGEDIVDGESTPYIVMELVEGRTVRELLVDEEAPPVDQALIIIAGVLEALDYSHRHGIVHRDIKPANVIITTAGAVKVMDFGIARALTGAANTMTQTGMVMGTPQYLSPEQALGKPVDHRSDLYAAGCMLYELLTLRPPFTGDTPLSVVYQHVQDAPVAPSEMNQRVPWQLDGLVLRALAKSPNDRFQSADEFRAHVQHALREMHGASGAGYAAGAAAAAAAAAGLAAAGSGHSGSFPGYDGTPGEGTAVTEAFGPTGAPGDRTRAMPYGSAGAGYRTPAAPYPGVGGPGGPGQGGGGTGGSGGSGGDGEQPRRRRTALAWGAGLLLLAAGGIGIALAVNSNGSRNPVTPPTSSTYSASATPSESPSASPTPTPSRSRTPSQTPTDLTPSTPTTHASHSASASASASGSASGSASASASTSGSASAPASSASPTGNTAPPPAPSTSHPSIGLPGQ